MHRYYREQIGGYLRGTGLGAGETGDAGQLHSVDGNQTYSGEDYVVYTDIEL